MHLPERSCHFSRVWRPCRRDATHSPYEADGFPTLCGPCATANATIDGAIVPDLVCFEVGRWHRSPCWERDPVRHKRLLRPEGQPLGWTRPS